MDDVEKKLNNVLGVTDVPQTTVVTQVKPTTDPDTDTDFQYTRENLYNLIERGTDAMEGLLQVAQETEHPRAYEVVGQLMDKLTSANKELINMHKLVKEINRDDTNKSPSSVTNALFVGSTAELQKLLKKKAG
jgi:hypothetical protein